MEYNTSLRGELVGFVVEKTPSVFVGAMMGVPITSALLVLTAMLVTIACLQFFNRDPRLPPGPLGLPYLGNAPQLGAKPYLVFTNKFWKKYGDVFMIQFPNTPAVVLNGHRAIREALLTQSSVFADRPDFPSWQFIANGCSITAGHYSPKWKMQKKLTFQALFSLNSHPDKPIDTMVRREADALVQNLVKAQGLMDPAPALKDCIAKIIFGMLFGEGEGTDDIRVRFLDKIEEFFKIFPFMQIHDMMPIVGKLFFSHYLTKAKVISKEITNLFKGKMDVHRRNHSGAICTTADAYIAVSKELPEEGHPNGLTKQQVFDSIEDIAGAGNETTSGVLLFAIRYMALYPAVQDKVHGELDSVLEGEPPTWEHKPHLPYVEATLAEVMRHGSVVPMAIPYMTTQDTHLDGHFIPQKTLVFANLHSANYDSSFWQDPETFNPNRFLTDDGCFNKELQNKNIGIFSVGKRKCIGEAIATKIVFTLFCSYMQSMSLKVNKDHPIPIDDKMNLSVCPVPFLVDATARNV